MNRDSTTISLWQQNIDNFQAKLHANEHTQYDVIIVGGGITGLTTALLLQKAGKKCLIAEAQNIGFGTTGGTTAHINTMLDSSYDQIINDFGEENAKLVHKITNEAVALIERNVREYKIDCGFKRLPAYLYAEDKKQAESLVKIFDGSKKVGVDIQFNSEIPIPIPFDKVVKFGEQAQFHPTRYLVRLAEEFEKLGGVILQYARVTGITEEDFIAVHTDSGDYKCQDIVYATHLPPGVSMLHFECSPFRTYIVTAKLKDEAYPEALVYDMQEPYHYFRTYSENGEKFLICGGEDHKTGHEENTDRFFRNLEAYLNNYFEVESIVHRWSSQYYEPSDGLPYIGKNPGSGSHVYVATGYSGNGITLGTAAAIVLSDILIKGKSECETLFNPSRISLAASIASIVKENVDVVGHFIGDWFSVEKIPNLLEIAPGDAKIVKYQGKVAAVYKDQRSNIHAVNPACTHVKCSVLWNSCEKSWDCPCHGSRFSVDGEVLVGPARKNLEGISMENVE